MYSTIRRFFYITKFEYDSLTLRDVVTNIVSPSNAFTNKEPAADFSGHKHI